MLDADWQKFLNITNKQEMLEVAEEYVKTRSAQLQTKPKMLFWTGTAQKNQVVASELDALARITDRISVLRNSV